MRPTLDLPEKLLKEDIEVARCNRKTDFLRGRDVMLFFRELIHAGQIFDNATILAGFAPLIRAKKEPRLQGLMQLMEGVTHEIDRTEVVELQVGNQESKIAVVEFRIF